MANARTENNAQARLLSEPDISLVGKQGLTLGVIEVKGGNDPAGALERYGAAKKPFEETLRNTPTAKTFFLASCITTEVYHRIDQDPTNSEYFNLTEIISDDSVYRKFTRQVFSLLGAIPEELT